MLSPRALLPLSLIACAGVMLTLPAPVHANPDKVGEIIAKLGPFGAVRGPHTISKEQKARLTAIAGTLHKRWGSRVYFVVLPASANNEKYAALYDRLGMRGGDLLAASNGKGLALRCNGLDKAGKERAWQAFRDAPAGPESKFSALVDALPASLPKVAKAGSNQLAKRGADAPATRREEDQASGGVGVGTAIFVVLLIGAVAGVIMRRKRRDAAILRDFKAALDPVETDLADMYLSMDGREDNPGFNKLLGQATSLSEKVDVLKAETPNREAIAKLRALSRDAAFLKDEMEKLEG